MAIGVILFIGAIGTGITIATGAIQFTGVTIITTAIGGLLVGTVAGGGERSRALNMSRSKSPAATLGFISPAFQRSLAV